MKRPWQRHIEDSSKKRKVDSEVGTTCLTDEGVSESATDEKEGMMEFDVFLSFRGPDTRKGFTGHLHDNLKQRGVSVFIDSEDLPKGEEIDRLLRKIQASEVFLPVFSEGYADSKWCLKELAKAVECGKKILPVFFNVEPSDVRRQSGECFKRAFEKHESDEALEKEEVRSWRAALEKAGSIYGYHLQNDARGYEAQLIQVIAKDVMTRVRTNVLDVAEYPVGLKPRVEEIKGMLRLKDLYGNGVVMIGIHGMGGLGKTTVAKALHNEIARNFDACSFLFDVRETYKTAHGLQSLQAQMVRDISGQNNDDCSRGAQAIKKVASGKKVLVILDDVDHRDQLKALAGGGDTFGKGSCIVVTTRDRSVLTRHGIEEGSMYAVERLNDDDSMELFCYHAFRSKQPPNECYRKLADEVVCTTGGLPLALEVLGSQFFDMKNPNEWEALMRKLKKYQCKDIYDRLRISYDELDDCEKEVFLDIACFFIGRDKEYPMHMWEACEFYPSVAIKVLLHKSLIRMTTQYKFRYFSEEEVVEEVFLMHDQIRDMGRNIVLQESSLLPGRRSRFWDTRTIEELQTMEEPRSVQGIQFSLEAHSAKIPANLWQRHAQLRYLCGDGLTVQGNCLQLPASLKWLSWTAIFTWSSSRNCELKQPSTYHFDLGEGIVILELGGCKYLARAFVGQSFLGRRKALQKLKILDLCGTDITTTPDFSNVPCPNLEKMILCCCKELTTVHESIGQLKRLEILDLEGCRQLSSLPITLGDVTSLKNLTLRACETLSSLPYTLGGITSLEELELDRTDIETLPDSIGELGNLKRLSLDFCCGFSSLPNTLGGMTSLVVLVLNSTGVETLPDSIGELRNLKQLFLDCENLSSLPNTLGGMTSLEDLVLVFDRVIETLPNSMGELRNLKKIHLSFCEKLSSLPNILWGMTSLEELVLDGSDVETVPDSIVELRNLKKLSLRYCGKLSSLPNTLGGVTSLESLWADDTYLETLPGSIGELRNLKELSVCNTQIETLPDSIWKLTNLRVLCLSWCQGLFSLPETLADMTSLEKLELGKVGRKNAPDSIAELTNLHQLYLDDTWIKTLPDSIGQLTKLRRLRLHDTCIEDLPESISKLTNIRELDLSGWERLSSLPNTLGDMTWMEKLTLDHTSVKTLPDSTRKLCSLESLGISGTPLKGLRNGHGIQDLMTCGHLDLVSCELLYVLPNQCLRQNLWYLSLVDPTVEALPEFMGQWGNLHGLSLKCKKLKALPKSISSLLSLKKLEVSNCHNLSSLPLLPASLTELSIVDCIRVETICISHSKSLTEINLHGCSLLKGVPGTENNNDIMTCAFAKQSWGRGKEVDPLKVLDLSRTGITTRLDFNNLQCPGLEELILRNCGQLKMVHESVMELRGLLLLDLRGCYQLSSLPNTLWGMTSLETLLLDCSSVEAIPGSIAALTNLRKLSLVCSNRSPYDNKLSSLPLLPPSLVELKISGCFHNVETMASISHLTLLTTLWLSGCPSLNDIVPGLENIVNNLEDLILPVPSIERSLCCDVLNDHFSKTVFQEATFDALCKFGWSGRIYFVMPGAGRQHTFHFMLPRHIPFNSSKEVTGELRFNGVLLNVNDDGDACWKAHVDVVDDDDLTIVPSKSYALLPRQTFSFWDGNWLVTQAIDLGRSCTIRVSLELPQEPVRLTVFLRIHFQR